jgi:stalled ribosome rescue protein Dom34
LAGLDIHAGLPEIATRVEVALDTWRLERRRALWHELTESGIVGAHAAFGVTATEAALRLGGVSRLLITEEFERRDPAATEAVVQLACEGDAQITYVGGDTAAHLQKRGAGIAARLRFPIPQPVA